MRFGLSNYFLDFIQDVFVYVSLLSILFYCCSDEGNASFFFLAASKILSKVQLFYNHSSWLSCAFFLSLEFSEHLEYIFLYILSTLLNFLLFETPNMKSFFWIAYDSFFFPLCFNSIFSLLVLTVHQFCLLSLFNFLPYH